MANHSVLLNLADGTARYIPLTQALDFVERGSHVEKRRGNRLREISELPGKKIGISPKVEIRGLSCRVGEYIATHLGLETTQVMLRDIRRQCF